MKSTVLVRLRKRNQQLRETSFNTYLTFMEVLLKSIEHDLSREMLSCLQRHDYPGLVLLADGVSSTVYSSAGEHRLCHQLSALVRKYPFPTDRVNFDPRKKALDTFLRSERKCRLVNKRFKLFDTLRSPHESALSRARSWISYVLGPFDLDAVLSECDFGPGASLGVHGNTTNQARKLLVSKWTVSSGAFYYAYSAICRDNYLVELLNRRDEGPYYAADHFELFRNFQKKVRYAESNKVSFVPKTVMTERTIAVEPLLNGYLQKGADTFMRKRLKRVGIDLSDQSLNQRLAREGSTSSGDQSWVTLDLSSASDSISIELCRNLLPPDWFDYLNSIRSHSYSLDGTEIRYQKFTTMGNGFCFPLETLLFASLCSVACGGLSTYSNFTVYGDDILIRKYAADRLVSLLKLCGFSVNRRKSFLQGPFRESCGADWFEGKDVRPINLDYTFESIENIFKFCNLCRSKEILADLFNEALQYLESLIPPDLFFVRPYKGNVDSALEVPLDVFLASPFSRWHKKLCCWSWTELVTSAVQDKPVQRFARYDIALMRGALTGSTSSVPFAERRKSRTKIRRVSYAGGWSLELPSCVRDNIPYYWWELRFINRGF